MYISKYFMPLLKENPSEAQIISHRYMLRAGMISQHVSGIYTWLPLGQRVLEKIIRIIEKEMDKTGAHQVIMPTIQSAQYWQESGRYNSYGAEMLRIKDRHGRDLLYGPTHEEVMTDIFRKHVGSYKNLPLNLYQIHWKFRDEIRPRFGVMRAREFLMKDNYSFDMDASTAAYSYDKMFVSYLRIFQRLGVRCIPMAAATGPIGGDLSHEFIILSNTGESEVYFDENILNQGLVDDVDYEDGTLLQKIKQDYLRFDAFTEEKIDEDKKQSLKKHRGIEVGHLFYFATKYSDALKALIVHDNDQKKAVHMGSYGIGVSRLVGAIIEAFHDDRGILWPISVAPFHVIILPLSQSAPILKMTKELYEALKKQTSYDILYDDTSQSIGSKFARADLIGIPLQVILSEKGALKGEFEVIIRTTGEKKYMAYASTANFIQDYLFKQGV